MTSTAILVAPRTGLRGPAGKAGRPILDVTTPGPNGRRIEVDDDRIVGREGTESVFHGVLKYVDDWGGRNPADEESLKKMVDLFPPSCIFDAEGQVLLDSGAGGLIREILFEPAMDKGSGVTKLTITCNGPRLFPPLLSVVSRRGAGISVQPFGRFEWVFSVEFGSGGELAALDSACRHLYCIEVR
jgi:hypothetical protein